jgi:hypothetical protein
MRLLPWCRRVAALCLIFLSPQPALAASPEHPWALLAYGAVYTDSRLGDILSLSPSVEDSYLAALALNREFARTGRFLGWEGEGQAVKHFGDQDHFEFNALVVARWHHFPWDRRLDTTLAVGEGLSWATETPQLEKENHSHATQLLKIHLRWMFQRLAAKSAMQKPPSTARSRAKGMAWPPWTAPWSTSAP